MRVILHHLKFAVFVQVLLGDVLPQQLLTYPGCRESREATEQLLDVIGTGIDLD